MTQSTAFSALAEHGCEPSKHTALTSSTVRRGWARLRGTLGFASPRPPLARVISGCHRNHAQWAFAPKIIIDQGPMSIVYDLHGADRHVRPACARGRVEGCARDMVAGYEGVGQVLAGRPPHHLLATPPARAQAAVDRPDGDRVDLHPLARQRGRDRWRRYAMSSA
eukprot:2822640-Prymnesium_polylepis.2